MSLGWAERIEKARKRGSFATKEVRLAASWNTCAVGERGVAVGLAGGDELINALGPAESDRLITLGCRFVGAVAADNFDGAARILGEIQAYGEKP